MSPGSCPKCGAKGNEINIETVPSQADVFKVMAPSHAQVAVQSVSSL